MIHQMISLDPSSRPTFDAALASARGRVLPECFYSFLHGYVASISERVPPPKSKESVHEAPSSDSDHRIDRIWEDYASVESHLLPPQQLDRTTDALNSHQVRPLPFATPSADNTQDIFPVSLQIPSYTPSPRPTPAEDGPALILLSLVLANIRNCSLPSSRIRALDILLALCAQLTDESKLDRAVPYVVELLRDEVAVVRAAAVRTLMQMVGGRACLSLILNSVQLMRVTVITPSNVSIFPEYIIPNVRYLVQDTEVSVRATYAQCIAPLADTALRYLEMGQTLQAHGVAPGANDDEVHFEVRSFRPPKLVDSPPLGLLRRVPVRPAPVHPRTARRTPHGPLPHRETRRVAQHQRTLHLFGPPKDQRRHSEPHDHLSQ